MYKRQALSAPAGCTSTSVGLKLLVLAGDGTEADLPAIQQALDYMGTPYTVYISSQHPGGLTAGLLSSGCQSFYQGVILTTGALAYYNGSSYVSGLSAAEWQTLYSAESSFGLRQLSWYTFPSPDYGYTGNVSAVDTSTTPLAASFTAAGAPLFPYVNTASPLSISLAYTYLAHAATDGTATPLLQDAAGDVLALLHATPDGRQVLALSFDSNPNLTHDQVLAYGLVNWVSQGLFLGQRHVGLVAQPDDVFIADDTWNPAWTFAANNCNHPVDNTGQSYRITAADVTQVLGWQNQKRAQPISQALRLQLAVNTVGSTGIYSPDTLTGSLQANQAQFLWIDHTYDHEDLTTVSYAFALNEFQQNTQRAQALGLAAYNVQNLVTPGITGLTNAQAMQAAYDSGVRYVVSDTSLAGYNNPSPNAGAYNSLQPQILQIPRHPTNLYFNVSQPSEWTAEYNCLYHSFWGQDLTYAQILDKESSMLLSYLLKGDLDPLMFHQSNLRAYDGTHSLLGDLLDATLAKYSALLTLPLVSPSMDLLGQQMAQRMAYNAAGVTATIVPGQSITLQAQRATTVPVTGLIASGSETYGGQSIAHLTLAANTPLTLPLNGQWAPPTVTSLSPASGPAGITVTVNGGGFVAGATTVRFGSTAATLQGGCTPTQCTVTVPAGSGAVDVTASAAGLTSATTPADRFTYAPPTITGLSPANGPAGLTVTVNGSGFVPGATTIQFGPSQAQLQGACTATQCAVIVPPGSGTVDVTATAGGLTSVPAPPDRYTYTAGTTFTVYGDALASGWVDWSFDANVNFANTNPVFAGTNSIAVTPIRAWGGLEAHSDTGISAAPYRVITFAAQASQPGANLQIFLADPSDNQIGQVVQFSDVGTNPVVGSWTYYSIPLSAFGAANATIGGIDITDNLGQAQPTFYIDEIKFVGP